MAGELDARHRDWLFLLGRFHRLSPHAHRDVSADLRRCLRHPLAAAALSRPLFASILLDGGEGSVEAFLSS